MKGIGAEVQLIDRSAAIRLIKGMAPDWTWLLQHIESEGRYIRFPTQFSRIIANLRIEDYPRLYENEIAISVMMLRAFLTPDEIKELSAKLESLTPEERGEFLDEAMQDLTTVGASIEIPKTPGAQMRAEAVFDALSDDDKAAAVKFWQYFMMAFLATFYQMLSIAVHGEKLTSLVAQAKAGNNKAFAKAVQIDKRILSAVPYFKQRFAEANTEGDRKFTEDVGAHLTRPPYKGKIRHKSLYLTFAYLDMAGLLETMQLKEILDLCDEAGVGGYANRIEDVKNLSKRLAEYRAFQRRGLVLSTP
jgi:hypothetical protein